MTKRKTATASGRWNWMGNRMGMVLAFSASATCTSRFGNQGQPEKSEQNNHPKGQSHNYSKPRAIGQAKDTVYGGRAEFTHNILGCVLPPANTSTVWRAVHSVYPQSHEKERAKRFGASHAIACSNQNGSPP